MSPLTIVFHSLLASNISDKKSVEIQFIIPLYVKGHFPQVAFHIFPLSLVFSSLTRRYLGLFSSYLPWLGFAELLEPVDLHLSPNWGTHLAIISSNSFSCPILSSPSGSPLIHISDVLISSHRFLRLSLFFSMFGSPLHTG